MAGCSMVAVGLVVSQVAGSSDGLGEAPTEAVPYRPTPLL
jgi:hypothetical protein